MIGVLLSVLGPILGDAVKRVLPDQGEATRVTAELQGALLAQAGAIQDAAGKVVLAEAQSGNWLTAAWRPLLMLTFGGLIVARWMGWAAPGLSEAEYLALWNIVELGVGGYVAGRTLEKVVPAVAGALGRRS